MGSWWGWACGAWSGGLAWAGLGSAGMGRWGVVDVRVEIRYQMEGKVEVGKGEEWDEWDESLARGSE